MRLSEKFRYGFCVGCGEPGKWNDDRRNPNTLCSHCARHKLVLGPSDMRLQDPELHQVGRTKGGDKKISRQQLIDLALASGRYTVLAHPVTTVPGMEHQGHVTIFRRHAGNANVIEGIAVYHRNCIDMTIDLVISKAFSYYEAARSLGLLP